MCVLHRSHESPTPNSLPVLLAPVVTLLALASSAVAAGPYVIKAKAGAMCRSSPRITNGNIVKKYVYGAPVTITCTAYGDSYAGYTLWDKTSDGCLCARRAHQDWHREPRRGVVLRAPVQPPRGDLPGQ
ncbi:uncharacterized protein LOC62_04G006359 [Vanrija pseudolonga]|uniref:Ig-like domain-containing protein n=1 Tax=Vanrija pseudolonga TaxID=143232 RepID=A0AAF0YE68_9TREE|nr:hypothetical protein LOC62_04G006359 [Vanrija pseudolonga]